MVKNGHRVSKFGPRDQKSLLTPPQNWWKHCLNHNKQLLKRPGGGYKALFGDMRPKLKKKVYFWPIFKKFQKIPFFDDFGLVSPKFVFDSVSDPFLTPPIMFSAIVCAILHKKTIFQRNRALISSDWMK